MQLRRYFDTFKKTAFGPWLARYKEFFKDEDLNKDKSVVQSQLNETDKDYKIVITSNDVIKVLKTSQSELFEKEITPHFIGQVFTAITNLQLQKFSDFILRLPEKVEEYINYFCNEKKNNGFSLIKSFKEVVEIDKLVEKFHNSPNQEHKDNYEKIKKGIESLNNFIATHPIIEDEGSQLLGEVPAISEGVVCNQFE
ncbi:hypothetical protein [Candidatus Tisiphia endosymbiont of Oplodontha viridula]|uniref:hypothetical protein n=1 Tax=Candidatus Tisiphia endosymbiont of Oplodontha viridula TaxID=3077925 RepID=UPI0035C8A31B